MSTSGVQTHDFLMRLQKAEDNLPPLLLELAAVMRRMIEEINRPQLEDIQGLQAELRRMIGDPSLPLRTPLSTSTATRKAS